MLTAAQIRATLPHRYPILLVDRVLDHVPGERISTVKAVTLNEPYYARMTAAASDVDYAYPEILMIESWGQSAALLAALHTPDVADKVMLFGATSKVEFHRRAFPGDVLEHHVSVTRSIGDTVIFEGETRVDGETAVTVGAMVLAFRPATAPA